VLYKVGQLRAEKIIEVVRKVPLCQCE
jgi:hypothetical protein